MQGYLLSFSYRNSKCRTLSSSPLVFFPLFFFFLPSPAFLPPLFPPFFPPLFLFISFLISFFYFFFLNFSLFLFFFPFDMPVCHKTSVMFYILLFIFLVCLQVDNEMWGSSLNLECDLQVIIQGWFPLTSLGLSWVIVLALLLRCMVQEAQRLCGRCSSASWTPGSLL